MAPITPSDQCLPALDGNFCECQQKSFAPQAGGGEVPQGGEEEDFPRSHLRLLFSRSGAWLFRHHWNTCGKKKPRPSLNGKIRARRNRGNLTDRPCLRNDFYEGSKFFGRYGPISYQSLVKTNIRDQYFPRIFGPGFFSVFFPTFHWQHKGRVLLFLKFSILKKS